MTNKEPITEGAPLLYTERKDGVDPGYNPRTDKWEIATDAMDKASKSKLAKRAERLKELHDKENPAANNEGQMG